MPPQPAEWLQHQACAAARVFQPAAGAPPPCAFGHWRLAKLAELREISAEANLAASDCELVDLHDPWAGATAYAPPVLIRVSPSPSPNPNPDPDITP